MLSGSSSIDQAYRTMATVWFILLLSQFMFFGVAMLVAGEAILAASQQPAEPENTLMVFLFATLALTNLGLSFVFRKRAQEQAVTEQKIKHVQTGLIIACAFCESISILGVVLAVAFHYQYFYLWIIVGIIGIFLHFPRRKHLLDASSARTL
ncbi:MAG TPA: hypothetical protein PKD24_07230 [Pyrinomonadaceae bacterium]|nr:hypothetical protein [Pyrinomonadaceae bacterium]HMP66972.1 hypothetical protein [Pyrinomonadaceae bacterium]